MTPGEDHDPLVPATPTAVPRPGYTFHGHPIHRPLFRGTRMFIARETGVALEYEDGGKRFVSQITGEWSDEIREGAHWYRVRGADLREIKGSMKDGTAAVPSFITFAHELILLTEEGLNLAMMKSAKPLAVEFREWLAAEVVPSIANTGKYDPTADARAEVVLPDLPRTTPQAALRILVDTALDRGKLGCAVAFLNAARGMGMDGWIQLPLFQKCARGGSA